MRRLGLFFCAMADEINHKKSNRGGQRPGAGRKRGSANQKTREIADRAAKDGITPLEVMLMAMRDLFEQGGAIAAFNAAVAVAPYMHPKMASIEHKGDPSAPVGFMVMNPGQYEQLTKSIVEEV